MEPHRLRRWKRPHSPDPLPFFTCARPGRSISKWHPISDAIVDKWVNGLPRGMRTAIVSLLGAKRDGTSEYSFYSFKGKDDLQRERDSGSSFQQWLDRRHPKRAIRVVEHPTVDLRPIPIEILSRAAADVEALLASGWTVVLMDSGGQSRTQAVCRHMQFVEDSRKL